MPKSQAKASKKKGRNQEWCKAYAFDNRTAKNKVRFLRKFVRRHPNDRTARESLVKHARSLGMKVETFHDLQGVVAIWGQTTVTK